MEANMFSSNGTRFGSPNSYPILVCAHGAESKNLCCKADIINQKQTGWHHWSTVDVEIEVTAEFVNLWTPLPKVELLSMMKSSRSFMRRNSEETCLFSKGCLHKQFYMAHRAMWELGMFTRTCLLAALSCCDHKGSGDEDRSKEGQHQWVEICQNGAKLLEDISR